MQLAMVRRLNVNEPNRRSNSDSNKLAVFDVELDSTSTRAVCISQGAFESEESKTIGRTSGRWLISPRDENMASGLP